MCMSVYGKCKSRETKVVMLVWKMGERRKEKTKAVFLSR